ncbi:MAG: hypothetical protein M1815_000371 [Lichina confinis]|nr:MAG: hypothetical protein M1815_000371 [Lichina confinis]
MARPPTLYPRATVRRIVKAHSKKNLSKNVDILIFLDHTLFLKSLVCPLLQEATLEARRNGQRVLSATDIKKVTEKTLGKFKG